MGYDIMFDMSDIGKCRSYSGSIPSKFCTGEYAQYMDFKKETTLSDFIQRLIAAQDKLKRNGFTDVRPKDDMYKKMPLIAHAVENFSIDVLSTKGIHSQLALAFGSRGISGTYINDSTMADIVSEVVAMKKWVLTTDHFYYLITDLLDEALCLVGENVIVYAA
jgi:hypothetical protein